MTQNIERLWKVSGTSRKWGTPFTLTIRAHDYSACLLKVMGNAKLDVDSIVLIDR